MRFRYQIVYEDGSEQTVTLAPIDRVRFEEKYVPLALLADPKVPNKQTWLYALAHFAYAREGVAGHPGPLRPDFEEWLEILDTVTEVAEDAPLGGTVSPEK